MRNRNPESREDLTSVFLNNARSSLNEISDAWSSELKEKLVTAGSFIEQGELELALNCLAEVGRKTKPHAKFWDSLSKAAYEMGLKQKASQFQLLWVESASHSLRKEINRK